MYLVLLGPPGAGKGSQAELLVQRYALPHISTGDMFRAAVKNGSALGNKAKEYMERGLLVPDEVTNGIVAERLSQSDAQTGFLLDGYPRTVSQAEFLEDVLEKSNRQLTAVIDIEVPDDVIIRRLSGRRVCQACGGVYHTQTKPPAVKNICDVCRGALVQRSDDCEETIRERLAVYRRQTEPLVDHYDKQGLLKRFDGGQTIAEVNDEVMAAIEALGASK